jgi:hypothetical protein
MTLQIVITAIGGRSRVMVCRKRQVIKECFLT